MTTSNSFRDLYCDLDGVCCDFYGHYLTKFGVLLDPEAPNPKDYVEVMNGIRDFYHDMPMLPDARELWEGLFRFHSNPIILTGIHSKIEGTTQQKREWVWKHFGPNTQIICCKSDQKRNYCKRGDVLVDDRLKWAGLWVGAGGIFVHHKSAKDSLEQLSRIYV